MRGLRAAPVATLAFAALAAAGWRLPVPVTTAAARVAPPTFTDDIGPLVREHCGACHRPGGAGPFSLLTYDDVRRRAQLITAVTGNRFMPPWKSDPTVSRFIGQDPLTDAEIEAVRRWAAAGAPEGDRAHLRPPARTEGWRLGVPDLVVRMPHPYRLRAAGAEVFRVFVLPVPVGAERFVRGLEFRPRDPRVVHHARIWIDRTPASLALDEEDPLPGYEGLVLRSARYPDGHFLGWTPGQAGPLLPPGLAWRLHPGSSLVMEMHLVPSGKPEDVEASVGLYFTEDAPERTPMIIRLGRRDLDIPPGEPHFVARDSFVLPVDVAVQSVQPHAHYRAREVVSGAVLPDGTSVPLISIHDWDVRWQPVYRYETPVVLPRGSVVSVTFVFDNSDANPRNPFHPARRVRWSEESTAEMDELWLQVLPLRPPDLATLRAAAESKMAAEDVVGYEARLEANPSLAHLHDEAAETLLFLGRPAEAAAHFAASLETTETATGHYNLGTALAAAGDLDRARAHLARAVAMRGDYPRAHNNLGGVLLRLGRPLEALTHFLEASRLDPSLVDARVNAGQVLLALGRYRAAIDEFRTAAALAPDNPSVVAALAWTLATLPQADGRDPPEAVRLGERAATLSRRRDARVLDVLGAAYAAAGRFAQATDVVDEALALEPGGALVSVFRARRAMYERRVPLVIRAAPVPQG